MKILLMTLALVSTSALAQFVYNYEIPCAETNQIIESLKSAKYTEKLTWTGNDISDKSMYSLWVNATTNTWTLLKMSEARVSCVLGAGTDSKLILGESI